MDIDRDKWLAERRTGIGGSDAAAAVGLSKWKTPLELWLDKRGELEVSENDSMRWGTILEPVVRQEYANATGREVVCPQVVLRHPVHKFAIVNVDGIANQSRLYEGKTARTAEGWGPAGSDEVPQEYLIQVQHGMAVASLEVADIAVLIGGSDFRIYTIEADRELQEMLFDLEAAFWAMVESGTPPSPVNGADVKRRWRTSTTRSVQATPDVLSAVQQLSRVKAGIKEAEAECDRLEAIVQTHMQDAAELIGGKGKPIATWKSVIACPRFDMARFRNERPEVFREFLKDPSPQRRFLLKAEKGE